jgi:hypothetical protein
MVSDLLAVGGRRYFAGNPLWVFIPLAVVLIALAVARFRRR